MIQGYQNGSVVEVPYSLAYLRGLQQPTEIEWPDFNVQVVSFFQCLVSLL